MIAQAKKVVRWTKPFEVPFALAVLLVGYLSFDGAAHQAVHCIKETAQQVAAVEDRHEAASDTVNANSNSR